MKALIAVACLLVAAESAPAQNYYRAVQQARRTSAQNAAEQQRLQRAENGPAAPAPVAPATAPAAPAAPVNPVLQATLNNIASLQSDFAGLINAAGDKPDPARKTSLLNNLTQAAQGTKASADSVQKLADDLATAVTGKNKLAAAQQTKLARDVHALFNSAHLSAAQQKLLLDEVRKTLTDGGASPDTAAGVVADLQTVASETK
jgi:hypothetical protein